MVAGLAQLRTVAGCIAYGCGVHHIRLQTALRTVTDWDTYGCRPYYIRLQAGIHTEIQRLPASPRRMQTAPSRTSDGGRLVPRAQRSTAKMVHYMVHYMVYCKVHCIVHCMVPYMVQYMAHCTSAPVKRWCAWMPQEKSATPRCLGYIRLQPGVQRLQAPLHLAAGQVQTRRLGVG